MDDRQEAPNRKSGIINSLKRFTRTTKGGDLLVFFICAGIATIFWLFLSLYEETERDFDIPFVVENIPDSIVIVEPIPSTFNIVAQGKGVQFLALICRDVKPLKVNFKDYASSGYFSISRQKLDILFREYFGQGVKLVTMRPESVKASFTSNVGKKIPIELNCDVQPNYQYVISGPIRANVDSVMVYSANDIPRDMVSVTTYPLVRSGLKDTTVYTVKIKPVEGMRIIPDQIKVTVPVEPLISKKRNVPIDVINVPDDKRLLIFPSSVDISYLVPMSAYNKDVNVRLFVDYSAINRSSQKVQVQSSGISGVFRNFRFRPDSVEYIIETKQETAPENLTVR